MSDTVLRVRHKEEVLQSSAACEIELVELRARFSLRMRPAAELAKELAGLDFNLPINTSSHRNGWIVVRLSEDEWTIIGPYSGKDAVERELHKSLEGACYAVTDISHRDIGISVAGERAAETINAGCPLDLSASAFPARSATRTVFGAAGIVLIKLDGSPIYLLECGRSYGPYLAGYLASAIQHLAI